jgi:hypothetical protein
MEEPIVTMKCGAVIIITPQLPKIKIKITLVRKDMDVNEHGRSSNFTFRHKLK